MVDIHPSTKSQVLLSIDALVEQISSFPSNARPYRQLYELIVNSLTFLEDPLVEGKILKKTTGKLGDNYQIEFQVGIGFNHLYLDIPQVGEQEGIHIAERKIIRRQPVLAEKYRYDKVTGERKFSDRIDIDQWWDWGRDNYRKS